MPRCADCGSDLRLGPNAHRAMEELIRQVEWLLANPGENPRRVHVAIDQAKRNLGPLGTEEVAK